MPYTTVKMSLAHSDFCMFAVTHLNKIKIKYNTPIHPRVYIC